MVYPENITFIQCRSCGSESADAPVQVHYLYVQSICFTLTCFLSSNASDDFADLILIVFPQCCKPIAHNIVPFLYMNEESVVVLTSVSLIHECGCDPEDPEVMTPS